jgi:hypothetical protein
MKTRESTSTPRGCERHAPRTPRWGRVARQFLDEIFSRIQRNSQDEVLGVFSIKNLVINDLKRERDQEFGNKRP